MMQGCPCSHSSIPCSSHGLPSSPSYHGCIRCKYFSAKKFSNLISKIKFCGKMFRCKIFLGKIFLTATKPIISWVYQVAVFLSKIFLQPNFVAKNILGKFSWPPSKPILSWMNQVREEASGSSVWEGLKNLIIRMFRERFIEKKERKNLQMSVLPLHLPT